METKPMTQLTPTKKPYATPMLHVYGSIAALTNAANKAGNSDGATKGNRKT